ncbi:MAG: zinc ribbon domain-containing protein, partial [Candidatus Thorarchaeota archaeon]
TCSACGERGYRIEWPGAREERRGGEYFYCPHCEAELHADVNAARNIIYVPSAVAGRTDGTACPSFLCVQLGPHVNPLSGDDFRSSI